MSEITDCVADSVPENANLIVAFASLEGDMVDQHFGSAQGFFVYDVTAEAATLITSKQFAREAKDGNEDKLKPKLRWLVGSDVVYCGSIGGSATRQLVSLGITPKKVTGGPDVDELIEELQTQLEGEPEFWLANVLKQKQKASAGASRFDEADDEDWG
ncbi:nitrogen fixation protein NifX [Alteromonadaceae bacterium 2753L.S.0a.02]|nr:nitrogen fixation protein NifX [Alteromonadaceae bacterium 2753L.S.0a.02]